MNLKRLATIIHWASRISGENDVPMLEIVKCIHEQEVI